MYTQNETEELLDQILHTQRGKALRDDLEGSATERRRRQVTVVEKVVFRMCRPDIGPPLRPDRPSPAKPGWVRGGWDR